MTGPVTDTSVLLGIMGIALSLSAAVDIYMYSPTAASFWLSLLILALGILTLVFLYRRLTRAETGSSLLGLPVLEPEKPSAPSVELADLNTTIDRLRERVRSRPKDGPPTKSKSVSWEDETRKGGESQDVKESKSILKG